MNVYFLMINRRRRRSNDTVNDNDTSREIKPILVKVANLRVSKKKRRKVQKGMDSLCWHLLSLSVKVKCNLFHMVSRLVSQILPFFYFTLLM